MQTPADMLDVSFNANEKAKTCCGVSVAPRLQHAGGSGEGGGGVGIKNSAETHAKSVDESESYSANRV